MNDAAFFCMLLFPITFTKSEDHTYAEYSFIQDLENKPISYKDFYDICGPYPLGRNSYFSVSLLIQPSEGKYIAGKGVYIIFSDLSLRSKILVSKSYSYANASHSLYSNYLPNKSFSTILPLVTFVSFLVEKDAYLENGSKEQLEEVVLIAKKLENFLLYWADKGISVLHISSELRFLPAELKSGNEVECENLVKSFKHFTLDALAFLTILSDNFIDRVLNPETAILYKEQFKDLDLFKSVILNKIGIAGMSNFSKKSTNSGDKISDHNKDTNFKNFRSLLNSSINQ